MAAHCQDRVFPYHQREMEIVKDFPVPSAAFPHLACEVIGPCARREIVGHFPAFPEHGRYQQGIPQHILPVQRLAGRVLRELQEHGAHHGYAFPVGLYRLGKDVGHQRAF